MSREAIETSPPEPSIPVRSHTPGSRIRNHFVRCRWPALILITALALSAGTRFPWSGPASLLFVALCFLAGAAILPRSMLRADADTDADLAALRSALLCVGAGMTVLFVPNAVLLYIGDFRVACLLFLLAAAWGTARVRHLRTMFSGLYHSSAVFWTAAISVVIGLYVEGVNEIVIGDRVLFTNRWDWGQHLRIASLIREQGMPLVNRSGAPGDSDYVLVHSGLQNFLAAIEFLTRTSLYLSARTIAILSFCLIALSTLVLVRPMAATRRIAVLAALSPLFWGGMSLPFALWSGSLGPFLDPYLQRGYAGQIASGTLYHNLTQSSAIALCLLSLVCMDTFRRRGQRSHFVLAMVLLVVAGLIKPSMTIVMVPALALVLAFTRERPGLWIIMILTAVAGFAYYLFPAWWYDAVSGTGRWYVRWENLTDPQHLSRSLLTVGIGWLALGHMGIRFLVDIRQPRSWQWHDVQVVALIGAVVFYLLFREVGREGHGNHVWSMAGVVITLSGLMVARIATWSRRLATRGLAGIALGGSLVALLWLQLLGGLIYAVNYPFFRDGSVPLQAVQVLEEAGRRTDPGTSFLVTRELATRHLWPYLGRPWRRTPDFPATATAAREDTGEKQGKQIRALLGTYRAMLLDGESIGLKNVLRDSGWFQEDLESTSRYELWLRP